MPAGARRSDTARAPALALSALGCALVLSGCAGQEVAVVDSAATAATVAATTTPRPTVTVYPVPRPPDFPSAGEGRLVNRLPPDVADRCTRSAAGASSPGASASLYCDLTRTDRVRVRVETFPTRRRMQRVYASVRRGQRVRPNTRACDRAGIRLPAERPWAAPAGRGRVTCFRQGASYWYVWTLEPGRTLAWATGERLADVRSFWSARAVIAGP